MGHLDGAAVAFGMIGGICSAVFSLVWLWSAHPWAVAALLAVLFLGFPLTWAFLRISGIV